MKGIRFERGDAIIEINRGELRLDALTLYNVGLELVNICLSGEPDDISEERIRSLHQSLKARLVTILKEVKLDVDAKLKQDPSL